MSELSALYQDVLLDHTDAPRNFGPLTGADLTREGYNPLCGDRVVISLKWKDASAKDPVIEHLTFEGEGCSICMASSSMLTEELINTPRSHALSQIDLFRKLMQSEVEPDVFESDVRALAGVRNFPVRIKCALLAWTTLNELLKNETHQ